MKISHLATTEFVHFYDIITQIQLLVFIHGSSVLTVTVFWMALTCMHAWCSLAPDHGQWLKWNSVIYLTILDLQLVFGCLYLLASHPSVGDGIHTHPHTDSPVLLRVGVGSDHHIKVLSNLCLATKAHLKLDILGLESMKSKISGLTC